MRLPELGLTAGGETFDDALDELVELAEAYAELFLERWDFYAQTDRRRHVPWVLRLALTMPSDRRALLLNAPSSGSAPVPEVA